MTFLGDDDTPIRARGIETHLGEEDVPSSRELIIEDWESGTISDAYETQTTNHNVEDEANAPISTSNGRFVLEALAPATSSQQTSSTGGLGAYAQPGDIIRFSLWASTEDENFIDISFGPYTIRYGSKSAGDDIDVISEVNGNLGGPGIEASLNTEIEFEIQWTIDNVLGVTITQSGNVLANFERSIVDTGSRRFRINTFSNNTTEGIFYLDNIRVKRRTPTYISETGAGVTELGNEVIPSGSIQTGPQEFNANALRGTQTQAPVNSDATQGDVSVLTLLQSGLDPSIILRRILDGQGGAYANQIDGALGRFARINANLSFEYNTLVDVPSWISATADTNFTVSLTQRPRRLRIEHTGDTDSNHFGGVESAALTTFQSLGGFRVSFIDVSYTQNDTNNTFNLSVGNHGATSNPSNTGDNLTISSDATSAVTSGTRDGGNYTTDWGSKHDLAIEYDGTQVRFTVDGNTVSTTSYTTNGDFVPTINLLDKSESTAGEVLEVGQVTVEPLPEVLQ